MDGRQGFFDDDDFFFRGGPFGRPPRQPGFPESHGPEDPINSLFRDHFGGHIFREMDDMMRNFGQMFSMFDRQFGNDPFFTPIEAPFRHPERRHPYQDAEDEDWKGPIIEELPPDAPLPIEGPQSPRRNPRDEVLKESRRGQMGDQDLDEHYRRYGSDGLFRLFGPDNGTGIQQDVDITPDERNIFRGFKSFSKSSAFSSVRLPNGVSYKFK